MKKLMRWTGWLSLRSRSAGSRIIPIARLERRHLAYAGAKAVTLARMMRAGLPVPPGFVLTTAAFQQFVRSALEWETTQAALAGIDRTDSEKMLVLSERIQRMLARLPLPAGTEQAIHSALGQFPLVRFWAVRSSATAEDLPQASFAGQHDSFLNVPREEIPGRVRQCWLSLFRPRAILYRIQNNIPHDRAAMAVIVQQMVPAETAGVLFTADPAAHNPDHIVIEGARGLGENVVGGRTAPDRIVLAKSSFEILARTPGGTPNGDSPPETQHNGENKAHHTPAGAMVLDDTLARRLAELSRRAEQILSGPLDIEWAARDGQIHLLQARPITGRSPARTWEERQVWTNLNTGEVAPDVMTPMTWSMIQSLLPGLAGSIFRLVGADITRAPLGGLVAGRIYFNANTVLAAVKPFSFLLKETSIVFRALGGEPMEAYRQTPLTIPPEDLPDLGFRWPKHILSSPRILYDVITHSPRRLVCAWMARFKTRTDELVRLDVGAMSTPELTRFCVRLFREGFKDWDLLYLGTQAAALPVFLKACRDWLGEPDLTLRLFAALGGMPDAEAGLALWRLAALAHADSDTEAVVSSKSSWPEVRARLCRAEHGRKFLAAWDVFMTEHGHHCRGELELFNARWCETPDYILGLVRGYLRSMGRSDPLENQRRLADERERLTRQCRRRLKNPIKRWIFSRSLRRAQELTVNRELWKSFGIQLIAFMRRVLLALGQRLHEQGSVSCRDDIFFLEISEIEPVAMGSASFDWRERIELRRREYEKNLKLTPPPVVIGRFDPNTRGWPAVDASAKCLQGIPVSSGVATGPARVILRTDDHAQVRPGEILIAPFTDPAWTPYFITAAGVVMEQGGILSHGSIVAREYGLPAVTNVGSATRLIRTGDLVQVDGNRGVVTLLSPASRLPPAESTRR